MTVGVLFWSTSGSTSRRGWELVWYGVHTAIGLDGTKDLGGGPGYIRWLPGL